jgi:Domain of unknown function (DUF4328)
VNGPAAARRDVRYQAFFPTVGTLGVIIALNATGIGVDVEVGRPAAWDQACMAGWLAGTMLAGFSFLMWLTAARVNAATYAPGGAGAYRQWTVAGWICPVLNLWVPYRMLADLLRASTPPAAGPRTVLARPDRGRARIVLLRSWCALWHAMWAALCLTTLADSGTGAPRLVNLAFQALSAGAAGCAIGVVVAVTRLQGQRAADPYVGPGSLPSAAPREFWFALAAVAMIAVVLLPVAPPAFDAAVRDLLAP